MLSEAVFSECGHVVSKRMVGAKKAYYEPDLVQWLYNYCDDTPEESKDFYVGFCNQYGQLMYAIKAEGETPFAGLLQLGYWLGLKDVFEGNRVPQIINNIPFSAMFMVDKTSRH